MPWVSTIRTADFDDDGLASAQAGKLAVALYSAGGQYFASALLCTHGQASLAEGYLEDFLIECPLHQGTFDIRTGEAVGAPCTMPVRTFPVRVEDGVIEVEVGDDEV